MKLELGNFYVKDIVFGDKTKYENGVLTVDKEECLAFVKRDPHSTEADLRIVKPGDKMCIRDRIRISHYGLQNRRFQGREAVIRIHWQTFIVKPLDGTPAVLTLTSEDTDPAAELKEQEA